MNNKKFYQIQAFTDLKQQMLLNYDFSTKVITQE